MLNLLGIGRLSSVTPTEMYDDSTLSIIRWRPPSPECGDAPLGCGDQYPHTLLRVLMISMSDLVEKMEPVCPGAAQIPEPFAFVAEVHQKRGTQLRLILARTLILHNSVLYPFCTVPSDGCGNPVEQLPLATSAQEYRVLAALFGREPQFGLVSEDTNRSLVLPPTVTYPECANTKVLPNVYLPFNTCPCTLIGTWNAAEPTGPPLDYDPATETREEEPYRFRVQYFTRSVSRTVQIVKCPGDLDVVNPTDQGWQLTGTTSVFTGVENKPTPISHYLPGTPPSGPDDSIDHGTYRSGAQIPNFGSDVRSLSILTIKRRCDFPATNTVRTFTSVTGEMRGYRIINADTGVVDEEFLPSPPEVPDPPQITCPGECLYTVSASIDVEISLTFTVNVVIRDKVTNVEKRRFPISKSIEYSATIASVQIPQFCAPDLPDQLLGLAARLANQSADVVVDSIVTALLARVPFGSLISKVVSLNPQFTVSKRC